MPGHGDRLARERLAVSAAMALLHLACALLLGTVIGLERTYRGRAAGARTYALVCTASALVILLSNLPSEWAAPGIRPILGADPSRVIQGTLTGIGFLGAGVIVRDGYSVRGLTSAASIWATAAIGIVIGAGYLLPAILFALATLCILSFMRHLENMVVAQHHIRCQVSCPVNCAMTEEQLRDIFAAHHFTIKDMSYDLSHERGDFRYSTDMWAHGKKHARRLSETLRTTPDVVGFLIAPSRD